MCCTCSVVAGRISYVLGIYRALQILLPEPERADAWVRRPNDAVPFGGRSALEARRGAVRDAALRQ